MIFHFHDYGRKGNASCQARIGKKPDCFGDAFSGGKFCLEGSWVVSQVSYTKHAEANEGSLAKI